MKNPFIIFAAFTTVWLAACAPRAHNQLIPIIPDQQRVTQAPTSNSETGVIVSGLPKTTLEQLVKRHKNISVRVVNPKHGLYEIFGQSTSTVRQEVHDPKVLIEKNSYVSQIHKTMKGYSSANATQSIILQNPIVSIIEQNQHVKLTGANLNFIDSCKFVKTPLSPTIQVSSNQGTNLQQTWIYFELGQSVSLNASESEANSYNGKLSYQWLITSPEDSLLPPKFGYSSDIDYTPDTTGVHVYSLIVKNSLGYCDMKMAAFYVTANDAFAPKKPFGPSETTKIVNPTDFWNLFQANVTQAWKKSVGKGITIAIIDSGVNYNHPALSPNIWINKNEIPDNGIDDDNNGFIDDVVGYDFGQNDPYPFDDYGHGSHVAGIAASPVFGAARGATILPIKATFIGGFDIATVAGAIDYAVDNGASIINLSVGWKQDYPVMRQAMNFAERKGVLITVAAGNSASNNDQTPEYPADYQNSNVISVAASDDQNNLAFYSNYGPHTVDIAAPGGTPDALITSCFKKNPRRLLFVGMAGTSMASPLVAGIAAQVWSEDRSLTASQVKQILLESGQPIASLKDKVISGRVIDAEAAVTNAMRRSDSTRLP